MIEVAEHSLKTLLPTVQQAHESPSEEPIFLTSSELQQLVQQAIQEATEPLIERINTLEVTIANLETKSAALEGTEPLYREIALDRQRIAKLEQTEPTPLQRDRGEILKALLAANGGKMFLKEARQKMHLIKPRFSELLATMKNEVEIKPYHLRKNQKVLVLK